MIDSPICAELELLSLGFPLALGLGEAMCDLRGCSLPGTFLTPSGVVCGACAADLGIAPGRWHRNIDAELLTFGDDGRAVRYAWYLDRLRAYGPVDRTPEIDRELEDLCERAVRAELLSTGQLTE